VGQASNEAQRAAAAASRASVKKEVCTGDIWTNMQIQPSEVCSWSTPTTLWQRHCLTLQVRKPAAAICGECQKLCSHLKTKSIKKGGSGNHGLAAAPTSAQVEEEEDVVAEAQSHAVARAQHRHANRKVEQVQQGFMANAVWELPSSCIFCGLCQSMEVPFFSAPQSSTTHHMLLCGIWNFGKSNAAEKKHVLDAHIHLERERERELQKEAAATFLVCRGIKAGG